MEVPCHFVFVPLCLRGLNVVLFSSYALIVRMFVGGRARKGKEKGECCVVFVDIPWLEEARRRGEGVKFNTLVIFGCLMLWFVLFVVWLRDGRLKSVFLGFAKQNCPVNRNSVNFVEVFGKKKQIQTT